MRRIRIIYLLVLLLILVSCNKEPPEIPVPLPGPSSMLPNTQSLSVASKILLEGIYKVTSESPRFGDSIVVKWNRSRSSLLFACNNGVYFIMDAGFIDSLVIIEGYWRDGYGDGTGLCSMNISKSEGGTRILNGNDTLNIIIRGVCGDGSGYPAQPLTLEFSRPFSSRVKDIKFNILAHRAGGRNSDRLPVSENSIKMIGYTEKLGSTGIEVDVRLSSDKVAFLYHDSEINTRLTKKGPLAGPISAYTWQQLSAFVRLIHDEKIPELEEALNFVVDSTLLSFVYLDMKESKEEMSVVIPVQQRILKRALDKGRDLSVVVGIPSEAVLTNFMTYPGYQNVPSLCELSVDDVRTLNSSVWAPRWTLGTQNDLVQQMHNEGRVVFCWTIDSPGWIKEYIENGLFDGLLTNYPYVVTYYHYIQQ